MGASASVDQGRPTGAHERDIGSSGSEKQYDWSQSKQAEAKQNTHSLQEKLESYSCSGSISSYCVDVITSDRSIVSNVEARRRRTLQI